MLNYDEDIIFNQLAKIISLYRHDFIVASLRNDFRLFEFTFETLFSNGDRDETIKGFLLTLSEGKQDILLAFQDSYIENHFRKKLEGSLDEHSEGYTNRILDNLITDTAQFILEYQDNSSIN
ncbi:hypothetical protein [Streptococcus hyointestinalis]|uniref:hypothetical protein n=1 Tax=Streptococcus hyointestinalis TaxID=1337 RepID=UPI003D067E84